jgi:hypothetical protein
VLVAGQEIIQETEVVILKAVNHHPVKQVVVDQETLQEASAWE